MNLTIPAREMLTNIKNSKRFPVVRFELHSSTEESVISIALNHVHIGNAHESMEQVKAKAAVLQQLESEGLIDIDYDLRITVKSDYVVYYESELYALLCGMVEEGRKKPGFLFDTPFIKKGLVHLTPQGEAAL